MSYEVYLAFMGSNGYRPVRFEGSSDDLGEARGIVARALAQFGAVVIARLTDGDRRVLLEVDGRDHSQRGELASGPTARDEPPGLFDAPYGDTRSSSGSAEPSQIALF